jgi:hypothetical protein
VVQKMELQATASYSAISVLVVLSVLTFYLNAGLLARSQYPEGTATGHLDTGFFLGFPVSNSKC